jgi:hypothetical protein
VDERKRDSRTIPGIRGNHYDVLPDPGNAPEGGGTRGEPRPNHKPIEEHFGPEHESHTEGATIYRLPEVRAARPDGLSRTQIIEELVEHKLDLVAFRAAYAKIHVRVQEVKDEQRLLALVNWSGTTAVMGALELSIHAMERVVIELESLLSQIDSGDIPNLD